MAVGDDLLRLKIAIHPSRAETDDNPFGSFKMLVCRLQSLIHMLKQSFFRRIPKTRVVAEGTVKLFSCANDFFMRKRNAIVKPMHRIGDADRIVKHPKRINPSVEAQTTANAAHLVGET